MYAVVLRFTDESLPNCNTVVPIRPELLLGKLQRDDVQWVEMV